MKSNTFYLNQINWQDKVFIFFLNLTKYFFYYSFIFCRGQLFISCALLRHYCMVHFFYFNYKTIKRCLISRARHPAHCNNLNSFICFEKLLIGLITIWRFFLDILLLKKVMKQHFVCQYAVPEPCLFLSLQLCKSIFTI